MGRFGADILALSGIAGGAAIATGLTAALLAGPRGPAHAADAACSSQVVVRLSSAPEASDGVKVLSTARSCNEVRVNVAEINRRAEWARVEVARFEGARTAKTAELALHTEQMEELRIQMESMRERMERAREAEVEAPLVEEALLEAREQLLRQIEEVTAAVPRGGND